MALTDFDLGGRSALVTGGGGGLGRQMAEALLDAGAAVTICGRRGDVLKRTADELGERGEIRPVVCDVTDHADVEQLRVTAGTVDILVNNAGRAHRSHWAEVTVDEWRSVMALNLDAPFQLCQRFIPAMIEQGWGRVINVSSIYGLAGGDIERTKNPGVDMASYFASKHGLIGLTRFLATQLGQTGVTVNALCPGLFPSPANRHLISDELVDRLEAGTPVGRLGSETDLRTAIVYLAAPGSSFVTGQAVVVDGGWTVW